MEDSAKHREEFLASVDSLKKTTHYLIEHSREMINTSLTLLAKHKRDASLVRFNKIVEDDDKRATAPTERES